MNVLKKIKKVAAVAAGAVMLTGTAGIAAAADLGDFPAPFVNDNGQFSGKIVIGDDAKTADVVGAIDVATALQAAAGSPVTTAGGLSVSGGQVEEVSINEGLYNEFGAVLDDVDLPGSLKEFSVRIDNSETDVDETYDAHEEIQLSNDNEIFGPHTAITMTAAGLITINSDESQDLGDRVTIPIQSGDLKYCFEFDEDLEAGNYLQNASEEDPVELEFLGRDLEVIDATASSVTVRVGQEFFLDAGDSISVDGRTITLLRTSTGTAIVEVDGQIESIDEGDDEEINGITVLVDDVLNDDGIEFDSAVLIIGEEAEEEYDNGDEFIGEPNDDDNVWAWELDLSTPSQPVLCANWVLDVVEPGDVDDNSMDIDHPLYVGESYSLPFGYAGIAFDSLIVTDDTKYDIDVGTETLYHTDGTTQRELNAPVIEISANQGDDKGFLVNVSGSMTRTETIFLYDTGADEIGVYYQERDGSDAIEAFNASSGNLFKVDYKKTTFWAELTSWNSTTGGNMSWKSTTGDWLHFKILSDGSNDFVYLGGGADDTANTNDIVWQAGSGGATVDISAREADARTASGLIVEDPDSGVQGDAYTVHVPSDATDYKANVIISGTGTTTTRTAGTSAVQVNPIAVGMAVSDMSAGNLLGRENLLVVGGPCVNTVAATLLSVGPGDDCAEGFEEGFGEIQWFDSENAMLVAGFNAADTTKAARVLADYGDYMDDFDGKSQVRVITSSGSVTSVE